eukprot:6819360-Heterocapsa_arctica.AAC.1
MGETWRHSFHRRGTTQRKHQRSTSGACRHSRRQQAHQRQPGRPRQRERTQQQGPGSPGAAPPWRQQQQ